ncbi:hypothetical protein Anapl_13091 [Anas platyrhynchos]|uniref:Uncharacterized protein n=1 Tax=Anas platyrhynchos TaxID=8839 RepID=R0L327_ANAPL|nr:hypothetical protein Anapl_13091 [Anas platyrhynchos]
MLLAAHPRVACGALCIAPADGSSLNILRGPPKSGVRFASCPSHPFRWSSSGSGQRKMLWKKEGEEVDLTSVCKLSVDQHLSAGR